MIAHLDDIEESAHDDGDIRAARQALGDAAGARTVGCSRWRVPAGARNSPVHVHADEEEIFYVLAGSGHVWHEGRAYSVQAGEAIVFPVDSGAHTLFGGPIDVLAFGSGSDTWLTWLPLANVMWAAPRWVPLDAPNPIEAEAALGPLALPGPSERPAWIVGASAADPVPVRRGPTDLVRRDLGTAGGSERSGLKHVVIAPGACGYPAHCHSLEEELFVVLDGDGWLTLDEHAQPVQHPVRRGSVVARPAGTGIAHQFRAGDRGLTLLAYGQRHPGDVLYYPRSRKIRLRGVGGITFRVDELDYWDGEE